MDKIDLPRERRVGHLTLLRAPRTITRKELNSLPFEDRLAIVRASAGRQKYELLLDAHDAERLVRRLPAQDLYLLIKELGLPDVQELLAYSDTDQITAFLDLDCWRGDLLDGRTALEWLAALLETGEEKVLETVREMDPALLALIFKKNLTVLRGPEDFLDEDARFEASQRDGGFEIDYHDAETAKTAGAFLELILRRDRDLFSHLMGGIRWEQEAMLEEENYRYRNDRLQDLGFPEPSEAPAVYAWLDPAMFKPADWQRVGIPAIPDSEAPAFLLSAGRARDLLAEVLAAGVDAETAWELTFILNRVMTADGVDIGNLEQVQEESGEVYRTLNLALEHLCGSDAEKATRVFSELHLQPLFRLGFSLTLVLQRRGRAIGRSLIAPYLDGPFRALIDALDHRKPRFFEGMENPTRGGERPFSNLDDLRLAEAWLGRLEAQRRLFEEKLPFDLPVPADLDLAGCIPDSPEDLTLSDFFLTALANRILGRPFLPRPVPAADLAPLRRKIGEGEGVAPDLREQTVQWLDSLEPGAGAFGHFCLDIWAEDLCALPPEKIDPRYLSGLMVKLD